MRISGLLVIAVLAGLGFGPGGPAWGDSDYPRIECTCRYDGNAYAQGAAVCMRTSGGPRLAYCDQVLNNSSWRITTERCQVISRVRPAGDPVDDLLARAARQSAR